MKIFVLVGCLIAAGSVHAQSSLSLDNKAQVVSACSIATAQHIAFGAINTLDNLIFYTAQGAVAVDCTKGQYAVTINGGNNNLTAYNQELVGGTYAYSFYCNRRMKSGSKYISYSLYTADTPRVPGKEQFVNEGRYASVKVNSPTLLTQKQTDGYGSTSCAQAANPYATLVFDKKGSQMVPVIAQLNVASGTTTGVYTDTLAITVVF